MRELLASPIWHMARKHRKYQWWIGRIAGTFLAIALIALFDGLLSRMRAGVNELEFLPGQTIVLSGPVALKNPLNSDVMAGFSPPGAPFHFELEGFFTGYWFGNGMWRGRITASDHADPGQYVLNIRFRGAPAQSIQKYELLLFASEETMQAASRSLIRRWLNGNPFIIAACCGGMGILLGLMTYWFGRRFDQELSSLGLAQIYASDGADIWCLAPQSLAPAQGNARMVLDAEGRICAEARCGKWQKGKLKLTLMDDKAPPAGALVCLRHPGPSSIQIGADK